jgi:hypothetical protein
LNGNSIEGIPAVINSLIYGIITMSSLSEQRLKVCETCDKLKTFVNVRQCGQCGCILTIKAAIKVFNCPLGKWPKVD